jgi:adenine C2-methylase RlmN of 23S rRNA A2503 and tRNA A37
MIAENRFKRLDSVLDKSINFFRDTPDGGKVEARFVQRKPERIIVYISSMTGCDKACRFCHLTQTSQTMATPLSEDEMLEQARQVLAASDLGGARTVHYNFMARGEPLTNPAVNGSLFQRLADLAADYGLSCRIKISSILPTDVVSDDGSHLFAEGGPPVDLYYSLYSLSKAWRRRWIPKALPPEAAMDWLRRFQQSSGNRVVLHWALIAQENDNPYDGVEAIEYAKRMGVNADFNLVRYNPASDKSTEPPEHAIDMYLKAIERALPQGKRAQKVSRVGYDVAASCGMFLSDDV